jgi:hypothetical protein
MMMTNLLKRLLLRLFSKRRDDLEAQGIEHFICPLCDSTQQYVRISQAPAINLGRVRFATVNQVAPIEDAIDKDVAV